MKNSRAKSRRKYAILKKIKLKRTRHTVYETKYQLVWAPKYGKRILRGALRERTKEIFEEIAIHHDFEIATLEIAEEHVHVFLSFPPWYPIAKVVEMLKSISPSVIFKEHSDLRKELWAGQFREDGSLPEPLATRRQQR
jgi:putative transposase